MCWDLLFTWHHILPISGKYAPTATMPEPLSQHVAWDLVTTDLLQADHQPDDLIHSDKLCSYQSPSFYSWLLHAPGFPQLCHISQLGSLLSRCYILPSSAITACLNDSELCLPWFTNQCLPGWHFTSFAEAKITVSLILVHSQTCLWQLLYLLWLWSLLSSWALASAQSCSHN